MEHGVAHGSPSDLLWPVINFGIFVAMLVYFLRGPVREYFRARTERIRGALEAGVRARREAEAARARLAKDLLELPTVRERLRADLRAVAEREQADLLAIGQQTAERIRTDARLLAEGEVVAARRAVRAEVVEEAVRVATAIIRGAVGPDDHERFVREFVAAAGAAR